MKRRKVIILRGIPGSGKSYEAKKYQDKDGCVVSADHYFLVDGEYRFDPNKIGDAHIACMYNFLVLLARGVELIVVDNTNTRLFELSPYRLVALAHGYDVEVVRMVCGPAKSASRNVHGVPSQTIFRMHDGFEDMPAFLGGERLVNN